MRHLIAVIAALVILCIEVIALHRIAPERPSHPVPTIDAVILAVEPSPDCLYIALFLNTNNEHGSNYADTLALYDVQKHKIVSSYENTLIRPVFDRKYSWSPDGRYFAVVREDSDILAIGKDGSSRSILIGDSVDSFAWHPSIPGRLVYSSFNTNSIFQYDMGTGKSQKITAAYLDPNIFVVNGSVCVSYFKGQCGQPVNQEAIYVANLDSGREMYRIPLYGTSDWDIPRLQISPDGRMIFLTAWYSAGVRNVVARIEDISEVFRKPNIALLWQDTIEDCYGIVWPPARAPRMDHGGQEVLAMSSDSCFWFSSVTGSRSEWSLDHSIKFVTRWNPSTPEHTSRATDASYVVVTNRGLELCLDTYNDLRSVDVLVRHRVQ